MRHYHFGQKLKTNLTKRMGHMSPQHRFDNNMSIEIHRVVCMSVCLSVCLVGGGGKASGTNGLTSARMRCPSDGRLPLLQLFRTALGCATLPIDPAEERAALDCAPLLPYNAAGGKHNRTP